MTNLEKFEYVVNHWFLKDGVVYAYKTQKPVIFYGDNGIGHRYNNINYYKKGARAAVYIHQAVYMLHHNRPIGEGMVIHHIDGDRLNNHPANLIELTRKQHQHIHAYQCDNPLRGISLHNNRLWEFSWYDDNGRHGKHFRMCQIPARPLNTNGADQHGGHKG